MTEVERLRSIISTIVFWIADDGYIYVPLDKEKIMQAVEEAASLSGTDGPALGKSQGQAGPAGAAHGNSAAPLSRKEP